MSEKQKTKHTIDATDRPIGRVATEAAHVLRGKNLSTFVPHKTPISVVEITNAKFVRLTEQFLDGKVYERYSGYPGGKKESTAREVIEKHGHKELLRRAIYGMLPSNKLRATSMKRLVIHS